MLRPDPLSSSRPHTGTLERIGHMPALDGVRGVAVLAVLLGHVDLPYFEGASTGVEIFFVLSGLLITRLLLEESSRHGRISLRLFYARRALRLFPALFAVVVVVSVIALVDRGIYYSSPTLSAVPAVMLYVGNWLRATGGYLGLLDHTWSLAIEEQFYLLWPPIVAFVLWRWPGSVGHRRLLAVLGLLGGLSLATRLLIGTGPESALRLYNGLDTRGIALLLGGLVAVLARQGSLSARTGPVLRTSAWFGAAFLLGVMAYQETSQLGGWITPLRATAAALVLAHLVSCPAGLMTTLMAFGPLRALGRVSYGLYLWHVPIFLVVGAHLPSRLSNRAGVEVVKLILTAVATGVSYVCIEQPALRYRKRFQPSATNPDAGPDVGVKPSVAVL